VATMVMAQYPEGFIQRRGLLVPHRQIGGEGIGEDEPRRAFGTFDPMIKRDAVRLDLHEERESFLERD
jgi:hypothetical protein